MIAQEWCKQFDCDNSLRINVFLIHIPALLDRQEDIPNLVDHMLRQIDKKLPISRPTLKLILSHKFAAHIQLLLCLLIRAKIISDTNVVDENQTRE